uniref:Reverse transcriptase domain-containing protein n=1 Tax=Halamphora calidilacuna TaxID=2133758 RepID=A0A2R4A3K8_9STRA|nr:hypothetical protein [Halamphora calidilacuna]
MLFFINNRSRRSIGRRHSLILFIKLDFVNNKKAPFFHLKFHFQNKITQRPFSSQSLNNLFERKRELENELTPLLLKNLKNNIWPLENPQIFEAVKNYIELSTYLLSVISAKKFIKSFATTSIDGKKILADDYEARNSKRPKPLVDRDKIKNKDNWVEILKEAELTLNSLLTKVWAIELISTSTGSRTPGIDGACFMTVPTTKKSKSAALKYLNDLIKKLKYDLSLSRGYTNQAIQRKSIERLNNRENYRRYLKSKEGKLYIKKSKELYRLVLTDPVNFVNNLRLEALENNAQLKFKLLKSLKWLKIKNYSTDSILRVYIPKTKDKLRPLDIPTLKDRTMQMFLKLVMEPYMEPLGDRNSFGFRPGRNSHQAVSYLYNRLSPKTSNTSSKKRVSPKKRSVLNLRVKKRISPKKNLTDENLTTIDKIKNKKTVSNQEIQNLIKTDKKIYYVPYYLLNTNIDNCFDKISHEWLISNVPLPSKYKFLLGKILKLDVVENNNTRLKKKHNRFGILRGGILSSLLINWTLDGLENLIFETVATIKSKGEKGLIEYYDFDKYKYYKRKDLNALKSNSFYRSKARVELKTTSWVIRYADKFIIGVQGENPLNQVKEKLQFFLQERGLTLSKEKTKIIKFNKNTKINFLYWTFHYLSPKRISWIIKTHKKAAGRLSDLIGLHVYPSKSIISKLKASIKQITRHSNSWKAEEIIIKTISSLVVGWSNYFSPAPRQGSIRLAIDWYIYKRMKRYIFKKYGNSYLKNYLRLNQNEDGSRKVSIGLTGEYHGRMYSLTIPRLYDRNAPAMWTELVPTNDLLNSSFLFDPIPYAKRAIKNASFRNDLKSKLFQKQKEKCPICSQKLINWNNTLYFDNYDQFMHKFTDNDFDLTTLNTHKYYSQINSATINPNLHNKFNMNYKLTLQFQLINQIVTFKFLARHERTIQDWAKGLDIDHIIPIKLAGKIPSLTKLLESINNLRLIHKECHKTKTFGFEEQQVLKEYRKTRKSLIPKGTKLRNLNKSELQQLHIKTILELEKNNKLTYLKNFKNKTIKKLFENYFIQVKKEQIM